ncbi:MAG: hypothetical protein QM642_07575 [Edaphocola sp.]
MVQVLNLSLTVAILGEILFLFTCGDGYMKLLAARERRNYLLEKVLCLTGAATALVNSMLSETHTVAESVIYAVAALAIAGRVKAAHKYYKARKHLRDN